ncbi:MAG: RES family NAD+ phosphorylase [Ignavibacteriota bacterium]
MKFLSAKVVDVERAKADDVAAKAAIKNIENLDLGSTTIDEINELLKPIFGGYSLVVPRFQPGHRLFRSRILDHKPLHLHELVRPPTNPSLKEQRVNRHGQSVFYGSTNPSVTIVEVHPKQGDFLAISLWKTTKVLTVNHVGYHNEAMKKLGSNKPTRSWNTEKVGERSDFEKLVDSFLARSFVEKDAKFYKLTIAIAEMLFGQDFFDALLYPSISLRAEGDNFAIKASFADNSIDLVNVTFAEIREVNEAEEYFRLENLDFANSIASDGKILWKGRLGVIESRYPTEPTPTVFDLGNGFFEVFDFEGNIRDFE